MALCCGNVSSYKQDSVWSWFICFCTTTCMILTIGFTFALGVLLPIFMDSFDESREKAGKFDICCLSYTMRASVYWSVRPRS